MSEKKKVAEKDLDDVEHWYELLEDKTFRSKFFVLSLEQAKAICEAYTWTKAKKSDPNAALDPSHKATLDKLSEQVQSVFDDFGCKEAFCRLSTRSPKDYALRAPKTMTLLREELKSLGAGPDDEILQVIAIIRIMSKCLKVSSGQEAVEFLINSERAFQDLTRRILECGEDDFQMNIIIREWADIAPETEFRGFVSQSKLTGLTQYYKACYVPILAEKKDLIRDQLVEFWEGIAPKIASIGLNSYVMDLAWTPERIWLVELNTFGTTASPSLFDWKKDHDVLHNGPFDFRVVEKPYDNAKALIARPLRAMMAEIYPETWSEEAINPPTTTSTAINSNSGKDGKDKSSEKCTVS